MTTGNSPHRELNPLLFDSPAPQANSMGLTIDSRVPATDVMGSREFSKARPVYPALDFKTIETQVAQLKGSVLQMERRTETIGFKMEELAKTVQQRLERFAQVLSRLEQSQAAAQQESAQRLGLMSAKMNERKVGEMKIQELIDRHNMIIQNFENRMHSLQRLVADQQMALHGTQATLDEARAEITRSRLQK